MTKYTVTGMSCAACQARVEKAVSKVEGVTECAVSLLTNSMGVEGDVAPADIIRAVEDAGYGAALQTDDTGAGNAAPAASGAGAADDPLADRETPVLKKRLIASVCFLLVLMYFSMGHHMWGWPLPAFFADNMVAVGIVQMLLAMIVMVINQRFFVSGTKSVLHGAPNMDTLVALGSGVSFAYSVVALLVMSRAVADADHARAHAMMNEFYFESAAMIVTLITVGKMLEAMSKGHTTDALKGLMKLSPKTATLMRDGAEVVVPVEEVRQGEIFVVRPGENIPVDGVVTEGFSAVNESALTGESIPVDKEAGASVSAGTINTSGFLRCEATRVGQDTTLSKIIQMVSDAAATKAPIARLADKVSAVFVPAVIVIAALTFVIWKAVGAETGFSLARAIAVLVISCPCALGLATPVAIMVGNGVAARNGILFKTSAALEQTGRVTVVALDKTGTVTSGTPVVTDLFPAEGVSEDVLLIKACALEVHSEHPLARAVMAEGDARALSGKEVTELTVLPGNGLTGILDGKSLAGGNAQFIRTRLQDAEDTPLFAEAQALAAQGKTPLFFAEDGVLLGLIAVADTVKEDSRDAIGRMREMGIRVAMVTGDNARTAKAIGDVVGVDEVVAEVLPDGKVDAVGRLAAGTLASQEQRGAGKTGNSAGTHIAFIGDGINDAPALTAADVGIAIGAGTDVAIDAADVVLMQSSLMDAAGAISLSRATLRNIRQNLFWAFFYNVIGIPLAAGVWYKSFGLLLNPMFGAAAMSLSSFCVCMNALRLNLFRMPQKEIQARETEAPETEALETQEPEIQVREIQVPDITQREENTMTKVLTIEGMMCEHCEKTVKKALEAVDGVESADVSHEKGEAVVTLKADVADDALKQAVEDTDYEVKQIA